MDEYLNSFPDEILVTTLLPQISLDRLSHLCSISQRFHQLCQNDDLWNYKVKHDFPDMYTFKPANSNWITYYRLLTSEWIPIYYHGDRIGYLPVSLKLLNMSLQLLLPKIQNITHILFVDRAREPVVIITYPIVSFDVRSQNPIHKIVLMNNPYFSNLVLSVPSIDIKEQMVDMIVDELASPLSPIPIYGRYLKNVEPRPGKLSPKYGQTFGFRHEGQFMIIDQRIPMDRSCLLYSFNQLLDMTKRLGIILEGSETKEKLCLIIEEKLIQIGHII